MFESGKLEDLRNLKFESLESRKFEGYRGKSKIFDDPRTRQLISSKTSNFWEIWKLENGDLRSRNYGQS